MNLPRPNLTFQCRYSLRGAVSLAYIYGIYLARVKNVLVHLLRIAQGILITSSIISTLSTEQLVYLARQCR